MFATLNRCLGIPAKERLHQQSGLIQAGRFEHEKGSFHVAKKIGKKPKASQSPAAPLKRPAAVKLTAKDSRKAAPDASKTAKALVKPAKSVPSKLAAKTTSKSVAKPVAKSTAKSVVAKVAAAVVKPVAAVAKTAAAAVVKPAKPAKVVIPMAEKSAVVTAYARPGAKFVPPSEPFKSRPRSSILSPSACRRHPSEATARRPKTAPA